MTNKIKELRKEKNLTQVELARRIGVSRSYINRIERGTRRANISIAVRIAKELDCKVEDIFLF